MDEAIQGLLRSVRSDGGCTMKTRRAFTLIELLVVVSIVALLMAILLPVLQGTRKRAQAAACQARLHQWSLVFHTEQADNADRTSNHNLYEVFVKSPILDPDAGKLDPFMRRQVPADLNLCPVASRRGPAGYFVGGVPYGGYGSTFFAEWTRAPTGEIWAWSYGISYTFACSDLPCPPPAYNWASLRGLPSASVPVIFDCVGRLCLPVWHKNPAPPYEDCRDPSDASYTWQEVCLNRHNGGVNYLFLDWSVRRVGLKELWTLPWGRDFITYGPWTKAGGVQPEDWPQWMRRFKDY